MPVGGEITAVNTALEDAPELVNNEPYSGGWMLEIKVQEAGELDALLTRDAYLDLLKG
jgi:glycine cleavage system H protein